MKEECGPDGAPLLLARETAEPADVERWPVEGRTSNVLGRPRPIWDDVVLWVDFRRLDW